LRDTFNIRGLDGLRFLGSMFLLYHHTARGKSIWGIDSSYLVTKGAGDTLMTLFFTLSGFLISYMLLKEKTLTGTVNLLSFYKRRITRIWPLYYLLVFLSIFLFENCTLFALPNNHELTNYGIAIPLYLLQLPNFHVFFSAAMLASLGHLWTIGVEEQFYSISPLIIKKTKNFVKTFLIIICVKFAITILFTVALKFLPLTEYQYNNLKLFKHFFHDLRFETFAIGGLGAYFYLNNKSRIIEAVNTQYVKNANLIFLFSSLWFGNRFDSLHILYAISFTIIIINLASENKAVFFLDNSIVRYLGRISYGIYMYQIPVIYIVSNLLKPYYTLSNSLVWSVFYYIFCFVLSIGISIISYEFMERKIMALARK
jgi:peptidoglycan/LPS O-acetylase OafA/YrhL